ncbi:unnamed protein product, partial [Amoebophrya sp. A25]
AVSLLRLVVTTSGGDMGGSSPGSFWWMQPEEPLSGVVQQHFGVNSLPYYRTMYRFVEGGVFLVDNVFFYGMFTTVIPVVLFGDEQASRSAGPHVLFGLTQAELVTVGILLAVFLLSMLVVAMLAGAFVYFVLLPQRARSSLKSLYLRISRTSKGLGRLHIVQADRARETCQDG